MESGKHVHAVTSLVHKHLEGEYHPSLASAAQHVSQKINGVRTDYLRTTRLYLDQPVPTDILTADPTQKIFAHSRLARLHFETRVQSLRITEAGSGPSLPIGLGRPFIPPDMMEANALNPSVWASYTPSIRGGPSAIRQAAIGSTSTTITVPADRQLHEPHQKLARPRAPDVDAAEGDPGEESSCKRRRKKRHRKPRTEPGAVVWDGDASSVPPVPLIVLRAHEDPGDRWRPKSTSLWLESLETQPRQIWRDTSVVSSFDEELPRVYTERRLLLESEGVWERTVEMVKRALCHRLLASRDLTMSELWTRRLGMGSEPCPVTDQEAAEWMRQRDACA